MRPLRVRYCDAADRDHAKDRRAYAHVFHEDDTICVARAFYDLPEQYQLGVLVHEIGHCLGGEEADEATATDAAERASGLRIHYQHSPRFGSALEWIRRPDVPRARRFVDTHIDFER